MMDFFSKFSNCISLKDKTWLGVGGEAKYFIDIHDVTIVPSLLEFCSESDIQVFVLGEGSNVVISDTGFSGLVIRLKTKDVRIISESDVDIIVHADAGLIWDQFVAICVESGWWGVENMSLIPGTVGASPVQNVGAYGQDCSGVIYSVDVYDMNTFEFSTISNVDCRFGFRSSIFNTERLGRYIITGVKFKLSKVPKPNLNRPEIRREVERIAPSPENLQSTIRDVVMRFRTSGKSLPNEAHIGSAGTFFRTTVVSAPALSFTFLKSLINLGPKPALITLLFAMRYRDSNGYRIPSRRLIDACKLESSSVNAVSLYRSNSAVLVTDKFKSPSSNDIVRLIKMVRSGVYKKTGFKVPIEPTLIGFTSEELDDIFS